MHSEYIRAQEVTCLFSKIFDSHLSKWNTFAGAK